MNFESTVSLTIGDIIMPKVYVLDNVIKRISENEASQIEKQIEKSDAKKLVIIDEKTQTVLMKNLFLLLVVN